MGLRDVVAKRKAERTRPKTLAELRARKEAERAAAPPPKTGLAGLRERKMAERTAKGNFRRAGLLYHNVQSVNGYWTVDVSNGDKHFTLHNRHGAWYHDTGHDGKMKEPVNVARALGTPLSQLEIAQALTHRLEIEMKARGIPTREQLLRQHEEEAKQSRRKNKSI